MSGVWSLTVVVSLVSNNGFIGFVTVVSCCGEIRRVTS